MQDRVILGDEARGNDRIDVAVANHLPRTSIIVNHAVCPGCPNGDCSGYTSVMRPSRPGPITKFD
jgi:hypothetical protein